MECCYIRGLSAIRIPILKWWIINFRFKKNSLKKWTAVHGLCVSGVDHTAPGFKYIWWGPRLLFYSSLNTIKIYS